MVFIPGADSLMADIQPRRWTLIPPFGRSLALLVNKELEDAGTRTQTIRNETYHSPKPTPVDHKE